jgi:hypothetical protein
MIDMGNNIILFGAGASFGSDISGTPPLGAGLFDALVSFNKEGWGQIPKESANVFRDDFEEGMKKLSHLYPHWMSPLQRAMADYFFNFIPQPNNLYRKLARRIIESNWIGSLATINYERLLELSLVNEGLKPIANKLKIYSNEIELCFPHGCCHLFCESVRGSSGNVSFDGKLVNTRGNIEVISHPSAFRNRIYSDAFPPVMSYFMPQKITTAGVNFIDDQRNRFSELISNASIVGIVGIRARLRDNHIWNPLAKTSAKLIYCSGKKSGQEFNNWSQQYRRGHQDVILENYFGECFDEFCKEMDIINKKLKI